VIKTGGSSSKTIVKVFEKPPPPPPKYPTGQHYDSKTRKCVDDTPHVIKIQNHQNVKIQNQYQIQVTTAKMEEMEEQKKNNFLLKG
jgi:hypothetical protein